jgi:hypothetical protein
VHQRPDIFSLPRMAGKNCDHLQLMAAFHPRKRFHSADQQEAH